MAVQRSHVARGTICHAEAAIQCVLTLRAVYHLALRAAQGLAESVFTLLQVSLPVPTYSTLSRRGARSEVALSWLPSSGPVHLVLDSSGFKVYGEGEWKVRQHGWSKRRTWRKLHLGVDETTGEILAAVASEAGVTDDDAVPEVLEQVDRPIRQVSADGAYDKRKCHEALEITGAKVTIPLRRNAIKLSRDVIASAAKQSLFSAEIASSLALLAMTDIH